MNTEGELEMVDLNVAIDEQPRNGLSIANPIYGASPAAGFHTPNRRMDHLLVSQPNAIISPLSSSPGRRW